jgi:xanthine/uracil/vitamin C permease (AzgA family)
VSPKFAGIGIAFIAYAGIKLLTGRWREIGPAWR